MNSYKPNFYSNPEIIYSFLNGCVNAQNDPEANREAFLCFKKSSKEDNPFVIGKLATFYEEGYGTRKNFKKAIECYQRAAQLGDIPSLIRLGDFYYTGNDKLVQDYDQAFYYYHQALRLSKEKNDYWNAPLIYERIACCLSYGQGAQFDPQGAITFYEYAISGYAQRFEQGDQEAQFDIERCEETLDEIEEFVSQLEEEQQEELDDSLPKYLS